MRNWLLWLLLLGLSLPAQERIALVIGNGDYQYWNKLKSPVREVEMVARELMLHGKFSLYGDRVWTNLNAERNKQLLGQFKTAVDNKQCKVALVYYVGNGLELAGKQYLVPVDMPQDITAQVEAIRKLLPGTDNSRLKQMAIDKSAVGLLNEVVPIFAGSRSRLNILVANVCCANSLHKQNHPLFQPQDIPATFTIYATTQSPATVDKLLFAEEFCRNLRCPDMTPVKMAWNLKTRLLAQTKDLNPVEQYQVKYSDNLVEQRERFVWGQRSLQVSLVDLSTPLQQQVRLQAHVAPEPDRVDFVLDGKIIGSGRRDGQYWCYNWDSRLASNGRHGLWVAVSRGAQQQVSAPRQITIANPGQSPSSPTAKIESSPPPGEPASGEPLTLLAKLQSATRGFQAKLCLSGKLRKHRWWWDDIKNVNNVWSVQLPPKQRLQWSDSLNKLTVVLDASLEVNDDRVLIDGNVHLQYLQNKSAPQPIRSYLCQGEKRSVSVTLAGHSCELSFHLETLQDIWPTVIDRDQDCLDMTKQEWQELPHVKQIALAKIYQQFYAAKMKLPVEKKITLAEGATLTLRLVPPGRFWMGSPDSENGRTNDEKRRRVMISRPFYLSKFEVTQQQWQAVMGDNPAHFIKAGVDAPIESVSWELCREFCRKTKTELPSEAQWEYACRGGTTAPFHLGDNLSSEQVNCDGNYPYRGREKGGYRGTPVLTGSLANGNSWGVYDLHGNVREWCADRAELDDCQKLTVPGNQDERDPLCYNGSRCIVRGGGWYSDVVFCRSASRSCQLPAAGAVDIGLRVMTPATSGSK